MKTILKYIETILDYIAGIILGIIIYFALIIIWVVDPLIRSFKKTFLQHESNFKIF